MPVLFIEAPPSIRPEKKRVTMQKITEAVDEAYHRRYADLSAGISRRKRCQGWAHSVGKPENPRGHEKD
jgi:hypothetical protein